jgi:hypothetical protein
MYYAVDKIPELIFLFPQSVGRGSSVGIGTSYGLDGPGIESRWGGEIFHTRQTGPGAHPPSYTMGTIFPGVKAAGAWR